MAGGGDDVAFVGSGEFVGVAVGGVGRADAVGFAVEIDGGDGDVWLGGEAQFNFLQRGIAGGGAVSVPIGLDHHVHEIRVLPGCRRAGEGGGVEIPVGGP